MKFSAACSKWRSTAVMWKTTALVWSILSTVLRLVQVNRDHICIDLVTFALSSLTIGSLTVLTSGKQSPQILWAKINLLSRVGKKVRNLPDIDCVCPYQHVISWRNMKGQLLHVSKLCPRTIEVNHFQRYCSLWWVSPGYDVGISQKILLLNSTTDNPFHHLSMLESRLVW